MRFRFRIRTLLTLTASIALLFGGFVGVVRLESTNGPLSALVLLVSPVIAAAIWRSEIEKLGGSDRLALLLFLPIVLVALVISFAWLLGA
jgi:hypothetical protein